MKKITTLMVMLVCCICSALAQTVASTPTAPENIQDGYYMLLVKSADGKTDDNGNFAHANSYDAKGSANDFVGKTLDDPSNYNYVYYITNNNGKLRIKSAFTDNWWETASGYGDDYRPQQFSIGKGATDFTYQKEGSWTYLNTTTTRKYFNFGFKSEQKNVFVTLNANNRIGYWDNTDPTSNTAQFKFYSVDIKLPMTVSSEAAPVLYYFVGGVDNPMKISHATSTSTMMRAESEDAASINDIAKDLWFVEGDFDNGFRFYNYNAQAHLMRYSTDVLSSQTMTLRKGDALSGGIDKWLILPLADNKFAVCEFGSTDFSTVWYTANPWVKLGAFSNSAKFSVEAPTFTYTMYNGNDGHTYNTFSAPFDVKLAANGTDVKMYKGVADYTAMQFNMTEINEAPAKEGVFLMGTKDESVLFEVTSGVAKITDNSLIGSTEDVTDLTDKLILGISNTTSKVGFFAPADGVNTLYANHAYLEQNIATAGLSLNFGGTPTGIGQVSTSDVKNAPIYDLTGRRVNHTVKGQLYIQGGRKFIAR